MPFDQAALKLRIEFLASKDLDGRVPGTEGDRQARAHIVERMTCLGLSVTEQPFKSASKKDTANVIGILKGTTDEIVIIGAHHDHEGNGHLGANDNASGVTGLLAVAQAIAQKDAKPKRTIAFIAFGAEEQGDVGSQFYAANVPEDLPMDKVVHQPRHDRQLQIQRHRRGDGHLREVSVAQSARQAGQELPENQSRARRPRLSLRP
jgi:acetylornithine deacetylase/succinyl-diaminopimelate desuccinylase-like protein